MRVHWNIAVPLSSIALISGLITISQAQTGSTDDLKCVQEAIACRIRAEQGDVKAENALGIMYSKGDGVRQDYAEALRWYRKAADRDYAKAQYNLGNMYYYGKGVPQDRAEAERWYHKAADHGDEYAERALGSRWAFGRWSAITLWLVFLGCLWALKDAVLPQANAEPQPRTLTIGGICGLVYIALSVYGHFSVFKTVLTVNMFHFLNNLVAGITVAMFVFVFAPKKTNIVLVASGILLLVNDLLVISRHELTHLVTTVSGFSSINGLLLGLTVSSVVLLSIEAVTRKSKAGAGLNP